jgi:hypothetical protein
MRKPFLLTILFLSSAWVVAQSSSTPPTVPDNSQANQPSSTSQQPDASQQKEPVGTAQNTQSLEGCITHVAAGYTLTDNSGKTHPLAGDTSKLADEVGHWDQVWGTEEGNAAGAASSGAPSTFTVRKIKMVSTTCPSK